jgi:hypothetical protein
MRSLSFRESELLRRGSEVNKSKESQYAMVACGNGATLTYNDNLIGSHLRGLENSQLY